jgi:hypothetical protein
MSVATTPSRIADAGAPATRIYSQIRVSVCVMVPKKTENALRFSAVLRDVATEVRFELAVRS